MLVGSLGDVVFETSAERVLTPGEFQMERAARFEEHKVVGALPRLEYLSAELLNMSMPIRLRADMGVNPARAAEKLSAMCREGKVLLLILAGYRLGRVVIESVSQTWRYMGSSKKGPQIVDLSIKLKEYV